MAPPLYGDLGKHARDLFSKGYNIDVIKIDLKTKTDSGVEFNSGGVAQLESGKIFGTLESKYKAKNYAGLTFSEKWNTDNVLTTEVSSNIVDGARVAANTSFAPQSGDKTLKLSGEYKNSLAAVNLESEFKSLNPVVSAAGVLGYNGWLCGYSLKFDSKDAKLKANRLSLGFVGSDFVFHTNVDDGKLFGGTVYQKLGPKLETGVQLAWSSESNDTKFAFGCKYDLENNASVRAKVNNASQIGLGYSQKLNDGVTLTMSAQVDAKNFNAGGHKVGFGFEFSP
ncbi:hypothetical protein WDU94_004574 [Cyamophila willieti]